MYLKTVKIINACGLHARPASDFAALAKTYISKINICRKGETEEAVNAKSVVMLLTLGIEQGEEVDIIAEGEDEMQSVEALTSLIASGFDEEE